MAENSMTTPPEVMDSLLTDTAFQSASPPRQQLKRVATDSRTLVPAGTA
jgi:hypothetical protein